MKAFSSSVVAFVLIALGTAYLYEAQILLPRTLEKLTENFRAQQDVSAPALSLSFRNRSYAVTSDGAVSLADSPSEKIGLFTKEKIISLGLFYLSTKKDPLLYSPDINLSNWDASVSKMIQARAQLFTLTNTYLPQDNREVYLMMLSHPEWVYPLAFLKDFAETTRLTETFLAAPSYESARVLTQAQVRAAHDYQISASGHLFLLNQLPDKLSTKTLLYLGSATDTSVITSDFELIAKNAMGLGRDIETRKNCLLFGNCPESMARPYKAQSIAETPPSSKETAPFRVPLELITPPHTERTLGPFAISSRCWGGESAFSEKTWPMYLFVSRYGDTGTALPMLANENYYWSTASSSYPSDQAKAERGIIYNDQAATNTYMCNDNSFYPKIMTLAYLKDTVQHGGVIVPEESALLSSPMPSDLLLPILEAAYAKNTSPVAEKRRLLIENKLAGFDLVMGKLYELMGVYQDVTYLNQQAYPLFSLLGERSSYSLLYLPFAASVWRIDDHPSFLLQGLYKKPDQYFDWEEFNAAGHDPYRARVWDTEYNKMLVDDVHLTRNDTPITDFLQTVFGISAPTP